MYILGNGKTTKYINLALSLLLVFSILVLAIPGCTRADTVNQQTKPVLLFSIGMHIEPFGAVISDLVPMLGRAKDTVNSRLDYNRKETFDRGLADIQAVVDIVEKHNGKMTVQTQTPFTEMVIKYQPDLFPELEKNGNEIGLHFHEDAHLGRYCERLSPDIWGAVMTEEIDLIKQAGANSVRYWSGGNLYPDLLQAANIAGLEVMSDYKNPNTQKSDEKLLGVNPWRPAGGPDGTNNTEFARNDPNGKIIYLPEGQYPAANYTSIKRSLTNRENGYFDYLKDALMSSVNANSADKVNVFHFTIHPGEYKGDINKSFAEIDTFLSDVVDPLVKEGKVKWATFSEMADAYKTWEASTGKASAVPGKISGKVDRNIVYGNADGVDLKMDIYYPAKSDEKTTAVLYVHGGAWIKGDKSEGAGSLFIPALVSSGYLVAAINYRLAPQYKFPANIEDVNCAVRYLRANALKYGINPDKIGALGGSAGGHLVSLLGVTDITDGFAGNGRNSDQSSRVQAVVDMFGPTDIPLMFNNDSKGMAAIFGSNDKNSSIIQNASPVNHISADDPPFLIIHGNMDTVVPIEQSQEFYDRLVAAGVPAKLVIVNNAGHAFIPSGGAQSPSKQEIARMIVDFFNKYLK
jgi:acetyl esterase/lipase